MSENQTLSAAPSQIGFEAIRALDGMEIPPIPPYYEVWFSHLDGANDELSVEIEQELTSGNGIDEIFLKNIHGKYFPSDSKAGSIEEYAAQLLNQTGDLKKLISDFDSSTNEFNKDLDIAAVQMRNPEDSRAEPGAVLTTLLQAAESAIKRNSELEQNLSEATSKIASLQEAVELIATDANTDFLTKLSNRRYFDSALSHLIEGARMSSEPLCLIVADIDHFKKFNDTWGHQIGDQVLKLVAGTLRENVKGQDLIARYGGEEFAIALPNTVLDDACSLAENIRVAVSKRRLVNKANNKELGRITMSFGVALFDDAMTAENIFEHADSALYIAKGAGRNRVEAFAREA